LGRGVLRRSNSSIAQGVDRLVAGPEIGPVMGDIFPFFEADNGKRWER
jgi:hypothetical protein